MENKIMRLIGLSMLSAVMYRVTNDIYMLTLFITGLMLAFHGVMFYDNQKVK